MELDLDTLKQMSLQAFNRFKHRYPALVYHTWRPMDWPNAYKAACLNLSSVSRVDVSRIETDGVYDADTAPEWFQRSGLNLRHYVGNGYFLWTYEGDGRNMSQAVLDDATIWPSLLSTRHTVPVKDGVLDVPQRFAQTVYALSRAPMRIRVDRLIEWLYATQDAASPCSFVRIFPSGRIKCSNRDADVLFRTTTPTHEIPVEFFRPGADARLPYVYIRPVYVMYPTTYLEHRAYRECRTVDDGIRCIPDEHVVVSEAGVRHVCLLCVDMCVAETRLLATLGRGNPPAGHSLDGLRCALPQHSVWPSATYNARFVASMFDDTPRALMAYIGPGGTPCSPVKPNVHTDDVAIVSHITTDGVTRHRRRYAVELQTTVCVDDDEFDRILNNV